MEIKNQETEVITGTEQPATAPEVAAAPAAAEQAQENPYKAEIERISAEKSKKEEELSKAQFKIQELKGKLKEKRETEHDEEEDVEDVRTAIDKAKAEAKDEFMRELARDTVKSELARFRENPDRMNLVQYHYENTIQKSGYSSEAIRHDIEMAAALADRVNNQKTQQEILAATISEDGRSKGSIGAGIPPTYAPETKFSAEDLAIMRRHGLTEKDVK